MNYIKLLILSLASSISLHAQSDMIVFKHVGICDKPINTLVLLKKDSVTKASSFLKLQKVSIECYEVVENYVNSHKIADNYSKFVVYSVSNGQVMQQANLFGGKAASYFREIVSAINGNSSLKNDKSAKEVIKELEKIIKRLTG